jgi:hypothetical protein
MVEGAGKTDQSKGLWRTFSLDLTNGNFLNGAMDGGNVYGFLCNFYASVLRRMSSSYDRE